MEYTLYQGSNNNDRFQRDLSYTFLATDLKFTNDAVYGGANGHKYEYKVDLNPAKIFDSTNCKHIELLYSKGFKLADPYLQLEEYFDDYDLDVDTDVFTSDNDYYRTAKDFCNSKTSQSNTWEAIEESMGVIDWLAKNFQAAIILERGYKNFIIFNKSTIKDIKKIQ